MKVGSLFSGGGLGDLGFMMAGCEIVFQVEIDDYCQKILNLRWPEVPKWRDIREVKGKDLSKCDIITGGFPCQPFSVAGKQQGKDDNRFLWPEMFRIISEVRPTWVVGENVSGFIKLSLDDVLNDLESLDYETTTIVFPAHALGAWHRRERCWIVAYSHASWQRRNEREGEIKSNAMGHTRLFGQTKHEEQTAGIEQPSQNMADTETRRLSKRLPEKQLQHNAKRSSFQESVFRTYWRQDPAETTAKPELGRVAYGIANRVHRLKCLGNGQVPACSCWVAERIMEYERLHP